MFDEKRFENEKNAEETAYLNLYEGHGSSIVGWRLEIQRVRQHICMNADRRGNL